MPTEIVTAWGAAGGVLSERPALSSLKNPLGDARWTREKRYQHADEAGRAFTWFETIAPKETPDPNAASREVWDAVGDQDRMVLRLKCDVGRQDVEEATWLYQVHTDIPDDVAGEYNEWYDKEHLPRLVGVPGVLRARRYVAIAGDGPRYLTAYDLIDRDAFESPEGLVARKTPWTARMRSLFFNTRRNMCKLVLARARN